MLYIYDRGLHYYVTTSLVTSNPKSKLPNFEDEDKTPKENMAMSLQLLSTIEDCTHFYKEHERYKPESMKKALIEIIRGKSLEEVYVEEEEPERMPLYLYIIRNIVPRKKEGTARIYKETANILEMQYPSVMFENVDREWLQNFVEEQQRHELSESYINIQLRNIRHAFNFARKKKLTDNYPFDDFHIKQKCKPKKKHLFMEMQEFVDFRDYPCEEWQQRWKDLALLSFYLCGINFADLLKLKEIVRGRIEFERQKTKIESSFLVQPEAMEIINRHRGKKYLLDYLDTIESVDSCTSMCNKALKKIGYSYRVKDKVGKLRKVKVCPLFPNMTVYTMRRGFASMLDDIDCPREVINMALSHAELSEYATTEIYIRRNMKKVDKWSRMLFDELAKLKGRPKEEIDAELKERYNVQ